MQNEINKLLSDLSKQTEKKKAEEAKPKVMDKLPTRSENRELNEFRYLLTLMLVAVKLGIFPYLDPNPLADWSWWLVFLPAYAIEVVLVALIFIIAAVAVIGLLVINGWFAIKILVMKYQRSRDNKSEIPFGNKDW